jgi:hypothetical protein
MWLCSTSFRATAVMSNLVPIQSSTVAETQVHASDGQDTPLIGTTPLDYKPPGGGESPHLVALRAKLSLVMLLHV